MPGPVMPDHKHTVNAHGILGSPRFVPDLPPRTQGSQRADSIVPLLAELKSRPNVWAAISESEARHIPATATEYFTKGRFGPARQWEVSVRKNPERGVYIGYVRWLSTEQRAKS